MARRKSLFAGLVLLLVGALVVWLLVLLLVRSCFFMVVVVAWVVACMLHLHGGGWCVGVLLVVRCFDVGGGCPG